MATIKINIDGKTGATKISAEGYAGPICKEKTKPFQDRLGTTTADEETSEIYNQQQNEQNEQQY